MRWMLACVLGLDLDLSLDLIEIRTMIMIKTMIRMMSVHEEILKQPMKQVQGMVQDDDWGGGEGGVVGLLPLIYLIAYISCDF